MSIKLKLLLFVVVLGIVAAVFVSVHRFSGKPIKASLKILNLRPRPLKQAPFHSTTDTELTTYTDTQLTTYKEESRWAIGYDLQGLEKVLQQEGHSASELPDRSAFWTNNIHLCINFNLARMQPDQHNIETLLLFYYPFFEHITIIFDSRPKRPPYLPEFVDYVSCGSTRGMYQQKCINLCIQRGKENTVGHFYVADDVFLNLTMMSDLPVERMWFTNMEPKKYSWILDPGPQGWGWMWWAQPYNNSPKLKKIIENLSPEQKQVLIDTAGFPDKFKIVATSDLIYIPQSLVPVMSKNLGFLHEQCPTLFCEIATCLAVDLSNANPLMLNYGYMWGGKTVKHIENLAKTAHFVHPVKLGVPDQHKLWTGYMTKQLTSIIGSGG